MPQIAVDSKGNKIRWDESKKEWVPVEKAIDAKGNAIEFDGTTWNPAPNGSTVVRTTKIIPPKTEEKPKSILPQAIPGHTYQPWELKYTGGTVQGPEPIGPTTTKDWFQAARKTIGGFLAYPASIVASGWASRLNPTGPKLPDDVAEQFGNAVGGMITGEPETKGGKQLAEAMNALPGAIFEPIGQTINTAATTLYPKNKEGQARVRVGLGALLLISPYLKGFYKGFAEARIKSGAGATPKEISTIIEKTPDIPKDVIKKVESTRLESPPEPTGNPIADAKAEADFLAQQRAKAEAAPVNSPGVTINPPSGPSAVGPKVGEIPPVKVGAINPINTSPAKILVESLKQAKPIQSLREGMYHKQRAEKFSEAETAGQAVGGEKGFEAAYGKMKGALEQPDFEKPILPEGSRDSMFQMIWDNPDLMTGERFTADRGLKNILDNGKFPPPNEVEMLNRVFGGELTDALMKKMGGKEMAKYWAGQIANIPRSIMASFDLSAPLRQGIWFIGRPRQFARAMGDMFKAWFNEEGYKDVHNDIVSLPTHKLARDSGLSLTEISSSMRKTEEPFMGVGPIERFGLAAKKKYPNLFGEILNLPGRGMVASERAYTGFLNSLRAHSFDDMVSKAQDLGLYNTPKGEASLYVNPKLSRDIAGYVNAATGRGKLSSKTIESGANLLNAVFFSPRLMASRFRLMNPDTYVKVPWLGADTASFVRKAALADLAKFAAFQGTVIGLSYLSGQEVGVNPASADFGKTLSGNTRIDMTGGLGSYGRLELQLLSPLFEKLGLGKAEIVSTTTGKARKIGGKFNEVSMKDIIQKFFEQKENPVFSGLMTILAQRDPAGGPIKWEKEITDRITPMLVGDIYDMAKDDPDALKILIAGVLDAFGAGVSTYPMKESKTFLNQSGVPVKSSTLDELKRLNINPTIGGKTINGQPIPEEDIGSILQSGGPKMERELNLFMSRPDYKTMPDDIKKKWLSAIVSRNRKLSKTKYQIEKKK